MFFIPNVIDNPNNPLYKLENDEIYSLKEAKELIILQKYSYSLFAIWSAIVINIQRRIEIFGINNFLGLIKEEESYDKNGNNLKDRWLNINEYNLIGYAQQLNIINHMTRDLITSLFWMKSNTKEKSHIDKEELFALVFLIEKNLFLKEFKVDKRGSVPQNETNGSNLGRRKKDREKISSSTPASTYHELLAKSGVKVFNDNLEIEKKNPKIIDGYI